MNDLVTKKKKKKDSFPVIFKKSLYQKKKKKIKSVNTNIHSGSVSSWYVFR